MGRLWLGRRRGGGGRLVLGRRVLQRGGEEWLVPGRRVLQRDGEVRLTRVCLELQRGEVV